MQVDTCKGAMCKQRTSGAGCQGKRTAPTGFIFNALVMPCNAQMEKYQLGDDSVGDILLVQLS